LGNKAGETKPFKDDGLSALTSGKMTLGQELGVLKLLKT